MRYRGTPFGVLLGLALAMPALLAGCAVDPRTVAAPEGRPPDPRGIAVDAGGAASASPSPNPVAPLAERVRPDLLVRSAEPIPAKSLRRLRDTEGVSRTAVVGVGAVAVRGESATVAAVDPSTYRVFAPKGTAESGAVWDRVARGDAVVAHSVAERLELPLGGVVTVGSTRLRIGAFATTVPGIDVVVDRTVGDRLGVAANTGIVLAAAGEVSEVATRLRRILSDEVDEVRIERLTEPTGGAAPRRAFLTGSDAARAFGTFHYRWRPDGSLWIDPEFVRANIRTERVPILGEVRCHRLMFPQLRGALQEVVDRGLESAIHPDQYGGCFVPKGIEGSPGAISLHTWGIAIDLNVPENLRGTAGRIDRRVVAIFKKWGFAWGGDWSWTDPMHFEMAGVLKSPRG